MEDEQKRQRLLPTRQDSAQDEGSPAPRFGSLTGRGTWRVPANRPRSSATPEPASLYHRNRGVHPQDIDRQLTNTTASTSGRPPSPVPDHSPARLHSTWQNLRAAPKTSLGSLDKENTTHISDSILWRDVPSMDDSPQRSPSSKSALKSIAQQNENIQVHYSNSSSPKGEAGLLSRPELEQMITWETNNLYEYLKDLYDRQHADLADYNSEQLRERLSKYHVMLEEQQGKNYQLADQLALKEDQITQLQRALDLRKAELQGPPGIASGEARPPGDNGYHFVFMPSHLFPAYPSYRWGAIVADSWRRHPKLWLLALIAALGLLLTIILCTLLVGCHHPRFTAGPDVIGRAGYSFDASLAVDNTGYVYYAVIPSQTFLSDLDPGDFSVDDVVTTTDALKRSKLQSMSVACGRVRVPKANSEFTLSVAGTVDDNSTECRQAAQLVLDGVAPELYCQRCPSLQSATDYVMLLVAVSDARRHCKSGLQLLPVATLDVTPPQFLASASASNVQESNFTLTVSLDEPGSVFYGIYYASFYTQYLQLLAAYSLAQPTSEEVLAGQAGSFQGALAASGRLEVPLANVPISSLIEPPCSGAICPQSMYALAPDTAYQVWLVAVDVAGNAQASPFLISIHTAPDTTPPRPLVGSGPSAVTTTSFGATFSLDTAGAVYYVISLLPGSATYVEPGSIVGPIGTTLVAPPTPATTPIYFTETLTVRGQPDTVTVNIPNTTVSSSSRHLMQQTNTMDDSNDALGFSPWDNGFLSGASESAMLRHLQQDTETTGTVGPACDVGPTCLSLNVSCKADATAAIIAAGGTVPSSRISLTGNTNPGCLLLPTAAGNVSLTGILGLNMNQMYQLTMVTEDTLFPVPNRSPLITYLIRTVDNIPPIFTGGRPYAQNIQATTFELVVQLDKAGKVFYLVTNQTDPAPSVAQVLAGQAYTNGSLVVPAAAGTIPLPNATYLDAFTDGTGPVANIDMASAYYVYLVGQDNYSTPNTMVNVTVLNVTTPSTVPPSFTVTAVSNFTEGSALMTVATNESALVYYMVLLQSATVVPSAAQVFNATSPDSTAVIDSGQFVTPSPRNNITHALHNLVDQVYYNVWLAAEDMQSPPLQQSTASLVAWQQPFLLPPQMNASLVAGSMALGDRFTFIVSLNVTGAAYFVVLPANASLPAVVDSQVLTTQNASAVLGGAAIAASGNVTIPRAFTNQSQVVLGLQSAMNYSVYVAGRDAQSVPNYATPATLLNVTTADVVPPNFTASTPLVTTVHETDFTLLVQLNKSSCTVYFSVMLATAPQPSIDSVLAGTAPGNLVNGTFLAPTAFTNYTILVNNGLVNQVLYRVWLIAKDSLGNRQTTLSSVTVMTVRTTPPSFQQLLVQYNAPSSVYIEVVMDEPCTVHFVGILRSRDVDAPTSAQVYNYTGVNGLAPDFNGTINATQAGIPFSSGACGLTAGTLYNVYVVAQDFILPPNLQAVPAQRLLNTSDPNAGFTCTAGIFTSHLRPDIVPVGASPGLPTFPLYGNVTTSTRFYRDIAAFNDRAPGTAGSVQALVNGTLVPTTNTFAYTTQALPPASVIATVRNLNIFTEDQSTLATDYQEGQLLSIAYQVRDVYGHAQINTANLAVTPHLTYTSGQPTTQSNADVDLPSCDASVLSPTTGTGTCNLLVPASYFPAAGVTSVANLVLRIDAPGTTLATSAATSIRLSAAVAHTTLSNVGMMVTVPYRNLHPGETFTVQVAVNSPSTSVASWFLPLYYDPSVIAYSGNTLNSALWATPYLNLQSSVLTATGSTTTKTFQYLSFNCPGRLAGTTAQGSAVPLMSITFTVLSSLIREGIYTGVLFAGANPTYSNANNLVLTSDASVGINIAKQFVAQVRDRQGGNQTVAQLYVVALATRGLWAYADSSELFNSAPLTGTPVYALVQAFLIRNWRLDSSDGANAIVSGFSCGAAVGGVFSVTTVATGCQVQASQTATAGSATASVTISLNPISATVPMLVWLAQNLQVSVDDPTLNMIIPPASVASLGTCTDPIYQRTSLHATCDFVGGGTAITGVDVTSLVTFNIPDSSKDLAVVVNHYVQGKGLGTAIPVFVVQAGTLTASTTVEVVNSFACLTKISLVAYTGATWLSPPASISPVASVTAQLRALQDFSFENSTASVRAYASYSDGFANDVTDLPGLNITSLAAAYLTVNDTVGNITAAVAATYGGTSYCGNGLNASLSVCSVPIGTGSGPVNISLPAPTAILNFVATPATITVSTDPATYSPLNLPISSMLSLQMQFSDGSVRDFSTDNRAVFTVTLGGAYCQPTTESGQATTIAAKAGADYSDLRSCQIQVTFPVFHVSALTATTTVNIVVMKRLVLRPQNYNYTTAQGSLSAVAVLDPQYNILQQISCNASDFEQATLWMLGTLTNGSTYDLTTAASTVIDPPPVGTAKLIANLGNTTLLNRLRPQLAGSISLTGKFGQAAATPLPMTIGTASTAVTVTSISLTATWCTSRASDVQCSSTFAGVQGATNVLEAMIMMSDTYTYTQVLGSARQPLDIIYIPGVFQFSSSNGVSISTQLYGDVTLLANANAAITLTMQTKPGCQTPPGSVVSSDATPVYANLNPTELDVDVGQAFGVQVQSQTPLAATPEYLQVGQSFAMEVRVNSASSPLIAYQLRLNYPSNLLSIASESSCQTGADWPASSLTFVCNARGSANSILFNSILRPPFASQLGSGVRVATITFTATAVGSGSLTVDILGLAQYGGATKQATSALAAAGMVQVVAAATGRRHLLRKDYGLTTASVPVHTVPPTSLSVAREATDRHTTDQLSRMQLAWASEVRAVRHRQLQQTCSAATSTTTFGDVNFDCQFTFVQDVLLLDSLRGSWDSNNQALYYGYLLTNSTNRITAGPGVCGSLLPHQRQELDIAYKYFSVLPSSSNCFLARPDGTAPTSLAAVVGQSYQAQPGSSEDKALYQLISAGLQWFLDGVYIGMPTVSDPRLNITVTLRDTTSTLLTTGNYTFVQVELQSSTALTFPNTTSSTTSGGTILATANFTGSGNFSVVALPTVTSSNNCGVFTSPLLRLAVLVASVDATGLIQNQSFYPYYGSSQKLVYQANAVSSNVYSSTFTPYTSFNLTDTYPPAFQSGYPTATNIDDTSFGLTCAFYESATVYYVVTLAASVDAVNSPPTTDNVRAGLLPASAVVTAKGTFTTANRLTGSALVTGLASASNYTAFLVAVDSSGNVQPGVSVLQGIITPDILAPTFTFLNFTAPVIDQNTGLFSMNMTLNTSLPAVIYYAMYRDYGKAMLNPCSIIGNPALDTIRSGSTLPAANCSCTGSGQCAAVNASSFVTSTNGVGATTLSGTLSALPFSGLTNQTCFPAGSLGTATDTYRVFMVARDNGTTYNGLARSCTPTSRLPALASGCSTTAFADCNQVQLVPDAPNYQSGSYVNWTLSNGTVAPAMNTNQHPLQFSVNLANQTAPAFYNGVLPQFTPINSSVQISFALTAPGLVIYSVSNVTLATPVDSATGPGSKQVGNGRIPVFMGGPNNVGYLNMTGCNGSVLVPSSQYLVQYWIRDKFATTDTVVQATIVTTGARS